MSMTIRFLSPRQSWLSLVLLSALLCAITARSYEVRQLEDAYELTVSEIAFPANGTGSITIRSCSSCATTSMRLNATVKYRLNGSEVALADFLATVAQVRDSREADENSSIAVFFNIQTRQLTRIELFTF